MKVSPQKGVFRFGQKEKLAPTFVGPFQIVESIGPIAYYNTPNYTLVVLLHV